MYICTFVVTVRWECMCKKKSATLACILQARRKHFESGWARTFKSYHQCHSRRHKKFDERQTFSIEIFAKNHCSSLFLGSGLGVPTWPLCLHRPFFDVPVHLLKYKAAEARPSSQRLQTNWRIFWKAPYFNPAVVFASSLFKSEK